MKRLLPRPLHLYCRGVQPKLMLWDSLPCEIFAEIAGFLHSDHLLNFSLTSSHFRWLLLPELYRTVALESSRACLSGLTMLRKHPELCVYIRTLIVRPNCPVTCWPRTDAPISERKVAAMIKDLVDGLVNLEKLDWGGVDLLPNKLCIALRRACPMLTKIVSSAAGSGYLNAESEVFNFDNLTAFALFVPLGTIKEILPIDIPRNLWDMLTNCTATLQELTLQLSYSSHHLRDLDQLLTMVFPRLRAFHLDIKGEGDPAHGHSQPFPLLSPFLSAHPLLTALSIHPSPTTLHFHLPPTALPRLTEFAGVRQHVAALPHPELLETLDLTGAPVSTFDITVVVTVLRAFVSLKSLDLRLVAPVSLAPIIAVCGGLTALRVLFVANFGVAHFGMEGLRSISASLRHLPHLRSFTLCKAHYRFTDCTMLRCALAFLADNPSLHEIYLTWFSVRQYFSRRQNGSYVVCRDGTGMRYVDVCERGVRSAKMGGGVFERRFRYALEGKVDLRASVGRRLARIRL
ncbi:hypothetical protein B0H12DRAFT_1114501 [Mycena haematopus]|nr:hypothetical protein B0H12DRAFT_1114501 [Mycena haematopus]